MWLLTFTPKLIITTKASNVLSTTSIRRNDADGAISSGTPAQLQLQYSVHQYTLLDILWFHNKVALYNMNALLVNNTLRTLLTKIYGCILVALFTVADYGCTELGYELRQ